MLHARYVRGHTRTWCLFNIHIGTSFSSISHGLFSTKWFLQLSSHFTMIRCTNSYMPSILWCSHLWYSTCHSQPSSLLGWDQCWLCQKSSLTSAAEMDRYKHILYSKARCYYYQCTELPLEHSFPPSFLKFIMEVCVRRQKKACTKRSAP